MKQDQQGRGNTQAGGGSGGSVNFTQQASQQEAMITFALAIPALIRWATTVVIIAVFGCSAVVWWKVHGYEEKQREILRLAVNIDKRTTETKKEVLFNKRVLSGVGIHRNPQESTGIHRNPQESTQHDAEE